MNMAYKGREARNRELAFSVLSLMKRERLTLKQAAAHLDVPPALVLRYVRDGLRTDLSGNYRAKPVDHLSRPMKFLTEDGLIVIDVHDSRDATLISDYMREVASYLSGDKYSFARFREKRIGPHRFVTDLDILDRLGDDELGFDSIYNFIVGGKS
jgi:hypothetical protein